MIVVEGPDGSGKTTLVNRLCTEFGIEVRPRACTSDGGPVEDLPGWIRRDLLMNPDYGIYDRYPLISEMIYGPTLRSDADRLGRNEEQLNWLLEQFYNNHPLIIYCLPPQMVVRANVASSHDGDTPHLQGVLKYVDTLWAAYWYRYNLDLSVEGKLHVMRWDYTSSANDYCYAQIADEVERRITRNV